jgi:hypothetical protein
MPEQAVTLSAIVPVIDTSDDFRVAYASYKRGLQQCGATFEVIALVLRRDTARLEELRALKAAGEPIRIVLLNRRFDDSTIYNIGVRSAQGEKLLLLTAYQQISGDCLPELVAGLDDADLVLANRRRRDAGFNRLQARIYSTCVSWISGLHIKDAGCDVKAMSRTVADEIIVQGDMHRYLPLLAHKAGFKVAVVMVDQADTNVARRVHPIGVYLRRVLDLLTVFFIFRFTRKPLRFFGSVGAAMVLVGAFIMLFVITERLLFGETLSDRPALLLSALMVMLGIQVIAIGLVGEIVIFTHAKDMDEYTIDRIVNE